MKSFKEYNVTLRRDVQQLVSIRVNAGSRQEAIEIAECAAGEAGDSLWAVEEHIGSHKPQAHTVSSTGAKRTGG